MTRKTSSRARSHRSVQAARGIWSCSLLVAIACAPRQDGTKNDTTTTLQAIDTLKVAADSMTARDSVAATPAQAKTPVTGTKTSTMTKARRDSIIGYDKATPLDPNKKLLDTVKKRPPF